MDRRLSGHMRRAHQYYTFGRTTNAAVQSMTAHEPGFLEAEEGERTHKVKQSELKTLLPSYNARLVRTIQIFDLKLNYGPYEIDYTPNGANMLMGGRQGHLALLRWKDGKILTEFNVKELVRDVKFLHNELLFAVRSSPGCAEEVCVHL